VAEASELRGEHGPQQVIAGRYEVGELRRGDENAGALREGVDLLIGRRVLLEMQPGGQVRTIELDHPGWRAPKLSGVFDGTAVVVHDWVPAEPVLPPDDQQASEQIERLLSVLAALAAAGKVHGGIVTESVALDGAGELSTLGSTLAAANLLTSPGGDAIALANVIAHALTGFPPLPSVAPSTALLAAARQTRPGLLPALSPLVALVHTPTVRRSSARKRRAMAAGVAFVLAGGGTAAALVARSITEPTTRRGAIPLPEATVDHGTAAGPTSSTSNQTNPRVALPPLEPPPEPPADVPPSTLPSIVAATPATRTDPGQVVVALAPSPPAGGPLPTDLLPPVVGPPSADVPVVKPPVVRPPVDDEDEDEDGDQGDQGDNDDEQDGEQNDRGGRGGQHGDDDDEGDGEQTPATEQ
jgi:hypothetical protein